jgi:hypothetical protein
MGYHSQVAIAIYPDLPADSPEYDDKYKALLTLMGTTFEYVSKELASWISYADDKRYMAIKGNGKWYREYEDVRATHEMLYELADMGYCYEFARVGEDDDDVETSQDGLHMRYLVNVHRYVTIE